MNYPYSQSCSEMATSVNLNCVYFGSSLPGMLISACHSQTLAIKPKMTKKSNDNRF